MPPFLMQTHKLQPFGGGIIIYPVPPLDCLENVALTAMHPICRHQRALSECVKVVTIHRVNNCVDDVLDEDRWAHGETERGMWPHFPTPDDVLVPHVCTMQLSGTIAPFTHFSLFFLLFCSLTHIPLSRPVTSLFILIFHPLPHACTHSIQPAKMSFFLSFIS